MSNTPKCGLMSARRAARRTTIGRVVTAALFLGACSSPTEGPDLTVPATVVISPATALLVSIGDTVDLTATVRNVNAQSLAPAVTWASNSPAVASVDPTGRVIATGNGTVSITASAGGVSGAATVTVEQVVQAVESSGDGQGGDVGQPLDSVVVVALLDARGNAVAGAPVSFVVSGSGTVDPSSSTTGVDGSVSTTWTLGTVAGIQDLNVSGGFTDEVDEQLTANGFPLEATALVLLDGNGQSELITADLAQPLRVQVQDSLGNGVPDMPVLFTASAGVLDAEEVLTDEDGIASVGLTLGSSLGSHAVTASVPDSLTITGLPLAGSPVALEAFAVAYEVATVGSLVVGDTVMLSGTAFDPTLESNTVLLGGIPATVLGGSQTELMVKVPSFGCVPESDRTLTVSRAGGTAAQTVTVTPGSTLALAVGERAVMSDASEFCLQFLSGSDDEYLVGLTSTSWFDGGTSFSMDALDPLAPAPSRVSSREGAAQLVSGLRGTLSTEAALRAWEGDLVDRMGASVSLAPQLAPQLAPSAVGDVLNLRLPDLRGDACVDYVPVSAEVFFAGPRVEIASTEPVPASGAQRVILDAALTALQTAFGAAGVDAITSLLGAPVGWDADSRVTVVLTPDVSSMGLAAYASVVDQLPRATCASSDEGHYVYLAIPTAATVPELVTSLTDSPAELAHQIAHIVQWSVRMQFGRNLLPSWIAEGQAEMVVDYVGMVLTGLGMQQDLGASVLADARVARWIPQRFDRLARFQGWDGAVGRLTGAPESCSLFGFASAVCDPEAGPGAAWSFLRYFSDRFGPAFLDGESGLQQALMGLDLSGDLVGEIEGILGVTLPELIVDWAGMLYVDGRLTPAQSPLLQLASWKLDEMIPDGPKRLAPTPLGFGAFNRDGTLVGGGTAYSLLTAAGAHGPLSVDVHDGAGGPIAGVLGARLWVVRMR